MEGKYLHLLEQFEKSYSREIVWSTQARDWVKLRKSGDVLQFVWFMKKLDILLSGNVYKNLEMDKKYKTYWVNIFECEINRVKFIKEY